MVREVPGSQGASAAWEKVETPNPYNKGTGYKYFSQTRLQRAPEELNRFQTAELLSARIVRDAQGNKVFTTSKSTLKESLAGLTGRVPWRDALNVLRAGFKAADLFGTANTLTNLARMTPGYGGQALGNEFTSPWQTDWAAAGFQQCPGFPCPDPGGRGGIYYEGTTLTGCLTGCFTNQAVPAGNLVPDLELGAQRFDAPTGRFTVWRCQTEVSQQLTSRYARLSIWRRLSAGPGVWIQAGVGVGLKTALLASLDPFTLPISQPVPTPMPVPYRLASLRRTNPFRSPTEQRAAGYKAPGVRDEIQEVSKAGTSVLLRPDGQTQPAPQWLRHQKRRTRQKQKEKKFIANIAPGSVLSRVINYVTESVDAIDAIWQAIPWEDRKKYHGLYRMRDGKWTYPTPQKKIEAIFDMWGKINWQQAGKNLLAQHVGDAVGGKLGSAAQNAAKPHLAELGRPFGWQTGPAL